MPAINKPNSVSLVCSKFLRPNRTISSTEIVENKVGVCFYSRQSVITCVFLRQNKY